MKKLNLQRAQARARYIVFGLVLLLLSAGISNAQTASPRPTPPPPPSSSTEKDDPPLTTFEEEMRAKRAIRMAEKDHEQNLGRAKEIADIAKDLKHTLKDKTAIDRESLKKIDRLEKLTKKIRGEAGGEDEEVKIVDRPADLPAAIDQLADNAEALSKTVQNTPRQVVSAGVINNANILLELIRMIRNYVPKP